MNQHETLSAQPEEQPVRENWLQRTLKFAGLGYLVGDAGMYLAAASRDAVKEKTARSTNIGKKIGAVSWATGGIAAFHFGNPGQEKQLELRGSDLEQFMRKNGAVISDDVRAQSSLLKSTSILGKAEQFLYRHPSQVLNTAFAVGAITTLSDGIKQKKSGMNILPGKPGKNMFSNMATSVWIGGFVLLGALGGLLIKEDPEAKEKAKNGNVLDKTVAWFKEKPLRFSALAYGMNNIPLAADAWNDFSKRNTVYQGKKIGQPFYYSTMQLGAYVMSNIMLALSGRAQVTKEGFAPEHLARLEDAAARVIVAQDAPSQQQLLSQTSSFIASQKGVTQDASTIAENLVERVTTLTQERLKPAVTQAKWADRQTARAAEAQAGAAIS